MIKKFAIALIALIAVTLAVGLALPRGWEVEQQVVIAAPPQKIHALLFDLKRWQDWSVWTRAMDPQLRNTYEGPQDGVGAKCPSCLVAGRSRPRERAMRYNRSRHLSAPNGHAREALCPPPNCRHPASAWPS